LHSELPEAVHGSPELRALRRAAGNAICWINDLFSLRKELARGETNNLVVVLQRAHRCSLQEAIDRTHAMTEGEILLFGERERCLPACAAEIEPEVRRDVIDLRNDIPATLKWTLSCPRYSQVEHTRPG